MFKRWILSLALVGFLSGAEVSADEAWTQIEEPGKIVPAPGEYAVLISAETAKNASWKSVADELKRRYAGTLIVWENDIASAEAAVKKNAPRYIAVVARPEELDRVVVAKLHRMTRRIHPDFYGDAIFGIITGRTAADAKRLIKAQKLPLLIERGLSTTNCDRERFKKHFFITDWGENEYIETENGISSEKNVLENGELVELFAKKFEEVRPQYLLSASHATEFNLEMPFGRGLIAPAKGKFYCFKTSDLPAFRRLFGRPEQVVDYAKKAKLTVLKATDDPKIWIAAGNCLFGDILRSPDSVAATLLSDYGVRQLVGYTVPTWYGVGWSVHGNFFNGHQDITVGQAWFFANQVALERLPEPLRSIEYPLIAEGMDGIKTANLQGCMIENNVQITHDNLGRFHDRDVIAFYGDPLFRTAFDRNAKNCQPWEYTLQARGKKRSLTVAGTQGKIRRSEFRFWFPEVCDTTKGVKFLRCKIKRKSPCKATLVPREIKPKFTVTSNFLMLADEFELAPDEKLVIKYFVKK